MTSMQLRASLCSLRSLVRNKKDKLLERLRGRYGDSDAEEEEEEGWETKASPKMTRSQLLKKSAKMPRS